MPTPESDTPRVDNEEKIQPQTGYKMVSGYFDRTLERELNAAKEQISILNSQVENSDVNLEQIKLSLEHKNKQQLSDANHANQLLEARCAVINREHLYFVSAIQGGLFGLTLHPSDEPLNGCLISLESKEKLNYIYQQVLKERQAIDSAIAAQQSIK